MTIYAAYRGDTFIAVGTAAELAEELGGNERKIRWYATPTAHKRHSYENSIRVYRLEDDETEFEID
jgi:hypothetical protein